MARDDVTRQLPLPFSLHERLTIDRFHPGDNGELVALVRRLNMAPSRFDCVWVWGERDSGRSHLLQAGCHAAGAAAYLPAAEIPPADVDLDGYAGLSVVAIDDVDRWIGDRRSEEALFHLYNAMLDLPGTLLLAASESPRTMHFAVRDLASRLRAASCHELVPLDEAARLHVVRREAAARGLELPDEVVTFLLARLPRGLSELLATLNVLDRESLVAQRRLTVPFVKRVLDL